MKHFYFVLGLIVFLGTVSLNAQDFSSEIKHLKKIGFKKFKVSSRVFVQTNEPVEYKILTPEEDIIILLLENTRSPIENNQNPLDTSYFDSPIYFVQAEIIEGPSPSVQVKIYLHESVPYKVIKNENTLALEFKHL